MIRAMVGRDPDESHRASTPLELLFDLCFVVAVAQVATQLHHGIGSGHFGAAVLGYLMVFFGIWWAWMNFTWFASAYDTDDVPYRLLTLVQIAGVLVMAAGIPAAFDNYDFTTVTIAYVIMRIALITQWLRAAFNLRSAHSVALRYAIGVGVCQLGWLIRLALPFPFSNIGFAVLILAELMVPAWAERRGNSTPWHPGHITERYGLFTLIVLGECVSAATIAMQTAINDHGFSVALLLVALGALLLVFTVWWSYFKHEAADGIRVSFGSALTWGYGHYLIFAAIAALGAGLGVVIDALGQPGEIAAQAAAFAVAIPLAVYAIVVSVVHARLGSVRYLGTPWAVVFAALALLAAVAAPILTLPGVVLILGLLMSALLAANLIYARRIAIN